VIAISGESASSRAARCSPWSILEALRNLRRTIRHSPFDLCEEPTVHRGLQHVRTSAANVVEAIASGIPATLESLRDAGMPDPRFFDQGLMITVTPDRTHIADQPSPTAPTTRLTGAERELMTALVSQMDVHELAAALRTSVNAPQKRLASLRTKGAVPMNGRIGRDFTCARPTPCRHFASYSTLKKRTGRGTAARMSPRHRFASRPDIRRPRSALRELYVKSVWGL
jgi:hypothetical protein